jgi:hypothetical protein
LVFAGILLILVAIGNRISTPLRPSDANAALKLLRRIPLTQLRKQPIVQFTAPNDDAWKRLRNAWGEPVYVVAITVARNEQACWEDFHWDMTASVSLDPSTSPAFGYLSACDGRLLGFKFSAAAGQTVTFVFRKSGTAETTPFPPAPPPPADLVILANWSGDMKQRLGEAYVDQALRNASNYLLLLGGVCLALSALVTFRGRTRS